MSDRSTPASTTPTPLDGVDYDVDWDERGAIKPPKKKRRKLSLEAKTKKVRGRRGILSSLKEFPLDVLFEIFGHLRLQDLLTLSRTTKDFRALLISRSSATIWKESRSRVEGLPDIPKDLSEPQYANLVFGNHCHECLAPSVQTVIWILRLRLCKKCVSQHLVDYEALTAMLDNSLVDLVPSFREHRGRQLFPKAFASQLGQESQAFRVDNVLQIEGSDFGEWRKRKREEKDQLNTHATVCATWYANRASDRSEELDDIRALRLNAIVERLTALGWGEEIPYHWDFRHHKLVRQPKLLTDRIWSNIEAPLVQFLTEQKTFRLEQEKRYIIRKRRQLAVQVYRDFVTALPFNSITPPKYEILCTEPFRELIEDTCIHPEEEITLESFAEAVSELPEFCADWRQRKGQELVDILKEFEPKATAETLSLATTFFRIDSVPGVYRRQEGPIGYPRILVHRAAITYPSTLFAAVSAMEPLQVTIHGGAWNGNKKIRPDLKASTNIRAVVKACNLDPTVTTALEMNKLDPVIECVTCATTAGRFVMRWIHAASHSCDAGRLAVWKRLQPNEELVVGDLEKRKFKALLYSFQPPVTRPRLLQPWSHCKLCVDSDKAWTLPKLAEHVKTEHGQEELVMEHIQYKVDTSMEHRHPQPFRWEQ